MWLLELKDLVAEERAWWGHTTMWLIGLLLLGPRWLGRLPSRHSRDLSSLPQGWGRLATTPNSQRLWERVAHLLFPGATITVPQDGRLKQQASTHSSGPLGLSVAIFTFTWRSACVCVSKFPLCIRTPVMLD